VLSVPAPGTYDYAFRFSGDDGATFTYCDGQAAGSSDGYQPANAGQMTSSPGAVSNLFISEYAEGSSNNKAFEIYNPAATDADLTGCEVRFYFNGNVVSTASVTLAGTLLADDVLVVCDDSIDPLVFNPANCDILSSSTFFNGDDALELNCSGTTLDVIGQIGLDPGTEWLVGGVGTADETLRRSCTVTAGDSNGADVFDPSLEWASFPQNTFGDFGQYVCP
jgi:predicted extracellular nuclease